MKTSHSHSGMDKNRNVGGRKEERRQQRIVQRRGVPARRGWATVAGAPAANLERSAGFSFRKCSTWWLQFFLSSLLHRRWEMESRGFLAAFAPRSGTGGGRRQTPQGQVNSLPFCQSGNSCSWIDTPARKTEQRAGANVDVRVALAGSEQLGELIHRSYAPVRVGLEEVHLP